MLISMAVDVLDRVNPFKDTATFWAAAGVLGAVVIGWAAVRATIRAAHPNRKLTYSHSTLALVRKYEELNVDLEVRRNGTPMDAPTIVSVALVNEGDKDITSAQFDQGHPIRIGFGLPVLEVLASRVQPALSDTTQESIAHPPPATPEGHELRIGPGRIGVNEAAIYSVLVDGDPSFAPAHSLIDVTVKEGRYYIDGFGNRPDQCL